MCSADTHPRPLPSPVEHACSCSTDGQGRGRDHDAILAHRVPLKAQCMRAPGRAVGGGRCADAARPRDKRRKRPDERIGSLVCARTEISSVHLLARPSQRIKTRGSTRLMKLEMLSRLFFLDGQVRSHGMALAKGHTHAAGRRQAGIVQRGIAMGAFQLGQVLALARLGR